MKCYIKRTKHRYYPWAVIVEDQGIKQIISHGPDYSGAKRSFEYALNSYGSGRTPVTYLGPCNPGGEIWKDHFPNEL